MHWNDKVNYCVCCLPIFPSFRSPYFCLLLLLFIVLHFRFMVKSWKSITRFCRQFQKKKILCASALSLFFPWYNQCLTVNSKIYVCKQRTNHCQVLFVFVFLIWKAKRQTCAKPFLLWMKRCSNKIFSQCYQFKTQKDKCSVLPLMNCSPKLLHIASRLRCSFI